jgi:hypothetical protein
MLLAACGDKDSGEQRRQPTEPGSPGYLRAASGQMDADGRLPALGICDTALALPEGSKVSFQVVGEGVQIYRWNGTAWQFVNPEADLYADGLEQGLVGTHFGTPNGPAWLTRSGSQVVGTVVANGRCTPNANAIPWLKLTAIAGGTGVFEQTTFIHRLNTVGGVAPSTPGSFVGDEAHVPYKADYFFYRAP